MHVIYLIIININAKTMSNECFYQRAKELADECIQVKGNNVYETLAKEYGIGIRNAGERFKSLFGVCIRDYITNNIIPTKENMRDAIIRSNSHEEMISLLNLKNRDLLKGLYDKYFGYSTYFSCKMHLLNEKDIVPYNPTIADNNAILISQRLGDGGFEFYEGRSCLKLEHGEKQFDYLKWKINLLIKAFPNIAGLENIRPRTQTKNGKELLSYVWRSNTLRNKYMEHIKETPDHLLVSELTPLGWLLYYLDDGYISSNPLRIAICSRNELLKENLIKELKTYGISANVRDKEIYIASVEECIKFIHTFCLPFKHVIPECMQYKIDIKI